MSKNISGAPNPWGTVDLTSKEMSDNARDPNDPKWRSNSMDESFKQHPFGGGKEQSSVWDWIKNLIS